MADLELVRSILQHLVQQQEQGRDPREVLRAIWLEATAALRRAISRLP